MRSLLVAVVVLGLAVALLALPVSAEPPPPMERRDLAKITAALKAKPELKSSLASVRFYGEVLRQTALQAPTGSPLETLGPWGDNGALLGSEGVIANHKCEALGADELAKASAIMKEYGDALPVTLRAYTLGQQGNKEEATKLFTTFIDEQLPKGACPSEHPMYSHRRSRRIEFALQCLKQFGAKDVTAQEKQLRRAEECARNNHAVG